MDISGVSGRVQRRKKRLKVTSTHNSTLCRNTTLNSTMLKQTLKTNNRALAKRLESIRFELAETQKLLLKEKEEKQTLHQKYTTLYKLVGLKDEEMEAEVERRMQARTNHMKENLNLILGNILGTVDGLQRCMGLCEPCLSRGSSLEGLAGGWATRHSASPQDQQPAQPKRSIYYQGPAASTAHSDATEKHVESCDPGESGGCDGGEEAVKQTQMNVLHQALDVILEQSGLGDSMMLSEDAGSRRNSKKSRPNSSSGSRRSSRRSTQLLGNLRRSGDSEEQPGDSNAGQDPPSASHLPPDERPIVSKFAPHIQGTTPASSPQRVTAVNHDQEEFYNRFIPLNEGSGSRAGSPRSTKQQAGSGGKKGKKTETKVTEKAAKEDKSKAKSSQSEAPPAQSSRRSLTQSLEAATKSNELEVDATDGPDSEIAVPAESDKKSEKKKKQRKSKKRLSSESNTADKGTKRDAAKECPEGDDNPVSSPSKDPSKEVLSNGTQPSAKDKRGTFVVKMTDVLKEAVAVDKRGTFVVKAHASTESSSEEAAESKPKVRKRSLAKKRGTFVMDKAPVVAGSGESDDNAEQVTRKTARRVRRGTFVANKEAKVAGEAPQEANKEAATAETTDNTETSCSRRGTFCVPSANQDLEEGIMGETDDLLMDTSVLACAPDKRLEESSAVVSTKQSEEASVELEKGRSSGKANKGNSQTTSQAPTGDDAVFKVPFPVSGPSTTQAPFPARSESSETDHTICEEEEMELTEVFNTRQLEQVSSSFGDKLPLPSFITRENSKEPEFLQNLDEDSTVEKHGKVQPAKDATKVKGTDKVPGKSEKTQKAGKDQPSEQEHLPSKQRVTDKEVKDDILETDDPVPKKKARHNSESDSSDGGKVRKQFSTYVAKPGKIVFKSGRKDVSEISGAKGGKKGSTSSKAKSFLPRAALKTTASKLKGKLLPSTSPLNRSAKSKNVFDLSLNESIPVPSSISYGQFVEQKAMRDQNPKTGETNDGQSKVADVTTTEHGIMLVLGNGKRTKPRRPRSSSKGVRYAQQLTEDHMITPAGETRTEGRTGETTGKSGKKKESQVVKAAGHTPPRKPLDSKQRKQMAESISKHNQEVAMASGDEDNLSESSPANSHRKLKVQKRRIVSVPDSDPSQSQPESEERTPMRSPSGRQSQAGHENLNRSLFSADACSPESPAQVTSPKSPVVELQRLNVRVTPNKGVSEPPSHCSDPPSDPSDNEAEMDSKAEATENFTTKSQARKSRPSQDMTAKHKQQKVKNEEVYSRDKRRVSDSESSDNDYRPSKVKAKKKKVKVKRQTKETRKSEKKKVLVEESDEESEEEEPCSVKAKQKLIQAGKVKVTERVKDTDHEMESEGERSEAEFKDSVKVKDNSRKVKDREKRRESLEGNSRDFDSGVDPSHKAKETNTKQVKSIKKVKDRKPIKESAQVKDTDSESENIRESSSKVKGSKRVKDRVEDSEGEGYSSEEVDQRPRKSDKQKGRSKQSSVVAPDSEAEERVHVKGRTSQKQKKSKTSEAIDLPVDIAQIKEELASFVEESENCEERNPQDESPCTGRRSRRAAGAVSYKEPSLTSKLRRGDNIAKTVYSGKDAPCVYKDKREGKKSTGRRMSSMDKKRGILTTIANTLE